jgi:transcriptional regulator with XRE-family HTH domain
MPMSPKQQRVMAARIRELRGLRPQPQMASEVGVSLRGYQQWEAGGGIKWSNLERLAKVHDVSPNYILYGEEKPRGPKTQLDRIEAKLDELLAALKKRGL